MYQDELVGRLRDEERCARVCIQHALPECTVESHDDGSRPSMYDLKIVYPDGSTGAIEVTAAVDGERTGLWREVRKRDLIRQEPDLLGGWLVRLLRSARARDLDAYVPGLPCRRSCRVGGAAWIPGRAVRPRCRARRATGMMAERRARLGPYEFR